MVDMNRFIHGCYFKSDLKLELPPRYCVLYSTSATVDVNLTDSYREFWF